MKKLLLILITSFLGYGMYAQNLNPGDIAFIGYHSINYQWGFTFMAIEDIPGNEEIYITNQGLISATEWNPRAEHHLLWTAPPEGLIKGDKVHISADWVSGGTDFTLTSGSIQLFGSSYFRLQFFGDQLMAYQADAPASLTANFIAGIQVTNGNFLDLTTDWSTAGNDNVSASILPWGLTNGVNCISILPDPINSTNAKNNAMYIGTSFDLADINDASNWINTDFPIGIEVCDFENTDQRLAAGDVAFIGYQSAYGDPGFTFIVLDDIVANTQIYFTDQGLYSAELWNTEEESHLLWTAPDGGLPKGTIVYVKSLGEEGDETVFSTTYGTIQVFGLKKLLLSFGGDQLLAYQACTGIRDVPTFLAGIHVEVNAGLNTGTGWTRANEGDNNQSFLPWRLENRVNCVSMFPRYVPSSFYRRNAKYTGTSMELVDINNEENWLKVNEIVDIEPCDFNIEGALTSYGALNAGDISFVGYRGDAYTPDAFSFATLDTIPGNEHIFITDQGLLNDTEWNTAMESHLRWTSPAEGLSAGTVVTVQEGELINDTSTFILSHGTIEVFGEPDFQLDEDGDQLLIYQACDLLPPNPNFITAVHSSASSASDLITGWSVENTELKSASIIPWGLTNGVNCLSVTPFTQNTSDLRKSARYVGVSYTLSEINDYHNWQASESSLGIALCDFEGMASRLNPGDIAFIGYNSTDGNQGFTFVATNDLPGGEKIYFSDEGVNEIFSWNTIAESHLLWTVPPGGLTSGAIIHIKAHVQSPGETVFSASRGTLTLFGDQSWLLENDGDQLLAYQTCHSIREYPNFIAGLNMAVSSSLDTSTQWSNSNVNSKNASLLPWDMENGVNCVALFPNTTNSADVKRSAKYIGSTLNLSEINNYLNWEISDDNIAIDPCDYAIGSSTSFCGSLQPGDIAFIGLTRGNHNSAFTFIALKDIPPNEEIYFTDQGLMNSSDWNTGEETHLLWTAPATGLPNGTLVHVSVDGTLVGSAGITLTSGTVQVFGYQRFWQSFTGDQLMAYQASEYKSPTPNFITGVQVAPHLFMDQTTGWSNPELSYDFTSVEPWGLANSVNCVSIFDEDNSANRALTNARYIGSTFELADINDKSNWENTDFDIGIAICDFETLNTRLSAGDIAFIGYQSNGFNAGFTFIALNDITANTEIYFTDQGLRTNSNWTSTEESHLLWTAPEQGLPTGAIIHIMSLGLENGETKFSATRGSIELYGKKVWELGLYGDQVLAYQSCQGIREAPNFLAGVNVAQTQYLSHTGWTQQSRADETKSYLPWGLENGVNCVSMYPFITYTGNVKRNAKYIGNSMDLADINNYLNWEKNGLVLDITPCDYDIDGSISYNGMLSGGDLAFIGYSGNENTPDGFTFVAINNIAEEETFYITDQGLLNDTEWNATEESHLLWTPPSGGLTAGEIVHIEEADVIAGTSTFMVSHGTITVFGKQDFELDSDGDQLMIYQGCEPTTSSPQFIAAIHSSASPSSEISTGWSFVGSDEVSTSITPWGLINGVNSVSITPATQNPADLRRSARYIGNAYTLADINDHDNWQASQSPLGISLCDFATLDSNLKPGDIAFIGYSSTPGDQGFTFVALTDMVAGTEIYFTDQGLNEIHSWNSSEESHLRWTVPDEGVIAGTIVHIQALDQSGPITTFVVNGGDLTTFGNQSWLLETNGDQLMAYQTCHDIRGYPNFIAGLNMSVNSNLNTTTKWSGEGVNTNNTSVLPWETQNGLNSVTMFPNTTDQADFRSNAKYISNSLELVDINNYLNWELTNGNVDIEPCDYDINDAADCTILPIELFSFNVKLDRSAVKIMWATASETNNDYFTVERSSNAKDWSELARINGKGNSTAMSEYVIYDENPITGLCYYRLKQADFDGQYSYSKTRSVVVDFAREEYNLSYYPNPVVDLLNLEGTNGNFRLFNSHGHDVTSKIARQENGDRKWIIDMGNLPAGFYILKTTDSSIKLLKVQR